MFGAAASALRHAANRFDSCQTKEPNEFLTWISFAVPGMLVPENVDAMEHAITNMPPGKPTLEIGSFCGKSTVVLSYLLSKRSKTTRILLVTSGNSKARNLELLWATRQR